MARFTEPNRITQVIMGELRVKRIGTSPQVMVKLAFMDDNGHSYGQTTLSSGLSMQTMQMLDQLYESIEHDAVELLSVDRAPPPPGEGFDPHQSNAFVDSVDDDEDMTLR